MSVDPLNKETLQLLFPLELDGEHETDQLLEGEQLDVAQASGDLLLKEMFPDQTDTLLTSWERLLGLTSDTGEPTQARRDKVIRKLRERGGLSIPYFIGLAEALGYQVEIEELVPFMAGWGCAGDDLYDDTIIYQWGVKIFNQPLYEFRAGESAAGEQLLWWDTQESLENLFKELKPAHTFVYFNYGE